MPKKNKGNAKTKRNSGKKFSGTFLWPERSIDLSKQVSEKRGQGGTLRKKIKTGQGGSDTNALLQVFLCAVCRKKG